MKRVGIVLLYFGVLCGMSMALAQNYSQRPTAAAPSARSSIVALNFNAAVLGTAEAQKSVATLQKKYAPREQELQKLNDDIETAKKSLNENAGKLTDSEKDQKLRQLETKEKQLQREAEDFKNDSQAESQEAFQQVAQKVFAFLQDFSRRHGYAAVLERGSENSPVVWYAADNVDITDLLTRSYDAKYGSSAPNEPDKSRPKPTSTGQGPGKL